MSRYAQLYLHGVGIYAWPNEVDPAFLFLFTKDERHCFVNEEGEEDEFGPILIYHLQATAAVLRDRLGVLGIGRTTLDETFNALVRAGYDSLRRYWDIHAHLKDLPPELELITQSTLALLERITVDEWARLFIAALKSPDKRGGDSTSDPTSFEPLLDLWGEDVDPRLLLGAALLACKPDDVVWLDVSGLVNSFRLDDQVDPQQIAAQHFSHFLTGGTPPVIITEGSTDAHFLQAAIRIRYPHLQS